MTNKPVIDKPATDKPVIDEQSPPRPGWLEVCILAAGAGTRMHSEVPKVLQPLAAKPLLGYLLDTLVQLQPDRVHIVLGHATAEVKAQFDTDININWVTQSDLWGTGHAVQQVVPHLKKSSNKPTQNDRVLILLGDVPLISLATIEALLAVPADLALLSVQVAEPFNYGRIIRDQQGVIGIKEEQDASDAQKKINEINTGIMVANSNDLCDWLSLLNNDNAQQEYLLTDIVEHANQAGATIGVCIAEEPMEVAGVNTFSQLAELERHVQKNIATELMAQGVRLMDPERLDVRGTLHVGKDVVIDINVIIEGEVHLGDRVAVGPNCVLRDSRVGAGTLIKANSVIEEATIGADCILGPFARLRPGTELADEVTVGNFVEVKKSKLGKGTKASHLAYLGDATIEDNVNIGAGTITCNYDGVNKHATHIGAAAFIGSNTSLVAPVKIGAGATIGAGSTITKDVASDTLALGRGKQKSVPGWQGPSNEES